MGARRSITPASGAPSERWEADGCFDAIFEGTVLTLHRADLLDVSVIHGDCTTTAAKKGGDNIGFKWAQENQR